MGKAVPNALLHTRGNVAARDFDDLALVVCIKRPNKFPVDLLRAFVAILAPQRTARSSFANGPDDLEEPWF